MCVLCYTASDVVVMLSLLFIFLLVVVVGFIRKIVRTYKYWKVRKINYIKSWPVFGSFLKNFFRMDTFVNRIEEIYYKYPDAKVVGIQQFNTPVLLLRDPELIKLVTIKQFENFSEHTVFLTEDVDPIFGKNLISLKGYRWKHMRSTLSPAFTSSKMRTMHALINECAEKFSDYFVKECGKENVLSIEMKDAFTRYTNDVIATTAFGIHCDSLNEKTNDFFLTGKKYTTFSFKTLLKLMGLIYMKPVMKFFGIEIFGQNTNAFFKNIVKSNVEARERDGIVRPDMIHLLMQARNGQLKHELTGRNDDVGFATVEESEFGKTEFEEKPKLTIDDITAQAVLFFLAGYETSSLMLSYLTYELACNPDVQKKLQDEIDEVFDNRNGNVRYEDLLDMKYLDLVVTESLRKWPATPINERVCSKAYSMALGEKHLRIEKDVTVWVPVYSLHHDEKYFPNPDRFDPERFSDENKENIVPFTYLPFGAGPRNCIGSRFALLEIKALCVHLLSRFEVVVTEKTQIPIRITKSQFSMAPEKAFWLGLKRRR